MAIMTGQIIRRAYLVIPADGRTEGQLIEFNGGLVYEMRTSSDPFGYGLQDLEFKIRGGSVTFSESPALMAFFDHVMKTRDAKVQSP
jgi:hypothetical protein